jgi:hypothetical protein
MSTDHTFNILPCVQALTDSLKKYETRFFGEVASMIHIPLNLTVGITDILDCGEPFVASLTNNAFIREHFLNIKKNPGETINRILASKKYKNFHWTKYFEGEKQQFCITEWLFFRFSYNNDNDYNYVGRSDDDNAKIEGNKYKGGQWVTPHSPDELQNMKSTEDLAKQLGTCWTNDDSSFVFTMELNKDDCFVPDVYTLGANDQFERGGKTDGGVPEIVTKRFQYSKPKEQDGLLVFPSDVKLTLTKVFFAEDSSTVKFGEITIEKDETKFCGYTVL